MPQRLRAQPNGSAALMALIILAGIILAASNVAVFLLTTERPEGGVELLSLVERYRLCPACFVYLTAAPVLFTILLAFLAGRRPAAVATASGATEAVGESAPSGPPSPAPALRLLAAVRGGSRVHGDRHRNAGGTGRIPPMSRLGGFDGRQRRWP